MSNRTPTQNLTQAANDLLNIKEALINKGVNIEQGRPTSSYGIAIEDEIPIGGLTYEWNFDTYEDSGEVVLSSGDIQWSDNIVLNIPDGVTKINDSVFQDKIYNITQINLPDSITSIGNSAFSNCSSLTTLTLPDSLTSIGEGAFVGCYALTTVNLTAFDENTIPSIETNTFYAASYTEGFKFLFANQETLDAFAADTNWSNYAQYFEVISE